MMLSSQQAADQDLARWQEIRRRFPEPEQREARIEALFLEFFAPVPLCDVLFEATQREVTAIMAAA